MLEQAADAEDMVGIANRDAAMHAVGPHDDSDSFGRLRGVRSLRFFNQAGVGNSTMHQIIVANAAFAKAGVEGRSAGGDDHRSELALKQIEGVVEARAIDRRRTARVFRRAKYSNRIRRMQFLEL